MLVVGSDATDNRLGRNFCSMSSGDVFIEVFCVPADVGFDAKFAESSVGSVRESLFMLRKDFGLVDGGRIGKKSASDIAEEAAEVEAELSPTAWAI